MQVDNRQEYADDQQGNPQRQVEPGAGRALAGNGIGVHQEHVQQPDRQGQTHPAEQRPSNVWFLQSGLDVVLEPGRYPGSGRDDPAEPGQRDDRQKHVGDLVLGRARR
jgi:hypothetical protein